LQLGEPHPRFFELAGAAAAAAAGSLVLAAAVAALFRRELVARGRWPLGLRALLRRSPKTLVTTASAPEATQGESA
jgi:hypothetical protein